MAVLAVLVFAVAAAVIDANQCTDSVCVINEQSLRFFAIGDFGGEPIWPWYSPVQKDVAATMAKWGADHNTHFQIELGDNFYYFGVTGTDDVRWKDTFENIYPASSAVFSRPWYVVAGNHDHLGHVEAEVQYTHLSNRWVFPSLNYTIKYQIGQGAQAKLVQFIMFDSITVAGNTLADKTWWDVAMGFLGKKRQVDPPGPADRTAAEDQWAWIEQQLQQSTADYLFVMSHFPVYSIGEHGPTHELIDRLIPLLHRYHVTMYMSGHDHSLQHFQLTENDSQGKPWMVDYVVNGAGSRGDHSTSHESECPAGALKFHYPTGWDGGIGGLGFTDGGFGYFEINAQQGQLQFLDKHGAEKGMMTFRPRK